MAAVSVSVSTIHFEVHGSNGPFLFLLHGWCCTHTFWRFQVAQLASRFRVVTLDYEGHGQSDPAVEASRLTIGRFADNVIAIADMLQAEELVLMGHSMGGPVAIEAALGLAGRCKFILGVDTFTDGAFYGCRPTDEIETRVQKFATHFERTMAKMVHNITAPQTEPATVAEIIDIMTKSNKAVALVALKSLLEWDIEARWPLLDIPVATINSAMLAGSAELDLLGLDLHSMTGVGHFPMMESADVFNSLALAILEKHGTG
ncbi:alpha/beta hydrolase [Rhizobium laguerreae]|uniref:alpha/beta fold hydrolase n=1 Tax=Rhizobium laguerreae TaxID=1076926 RepID=UPI001C91B832|nr:alpha/beta hydrolase [Rhizobium laguerreae]MBY3238293.1 alpha/beta hydrolase [Rhizobium laguerreae]